MDMQQRLAQADSMYGRVVNGTDRPAPGTYQMQLRSAVFRESNKGKWMVRWTFVILDGQHLGEECSDMNSLESPSPVPLRMLVKRVEALGFSPPPKLSGYQELCPQMTVAAPIVLADLSYSDGYDRINVTQLLAASGAVAPTTAPAVPVPAVAAPAVTPPAPAPVTAVAAPAPAVPAVPVPAPVLTQDLSAIGIGDTVQCKLPEEDGTFLSGIVDAVVGTTVTVGIDADRAFNAEADELVVTAKALVAAPALPATPPPIPCPVPVPALLVPLPAPVVVTADPQRDALITLAGTFGIQVNDIMTKDEVVATLKKSEWRAEHVTDAADVALLTSVGIPVIPTAVPEPAKPKKAKKAKKKGARATVKRKKRG